MQFVRYPRRLVVRVAFLVACSAIVALAQIRFVPAHYRDGALPQIPVQALGGGEVLLELAVSSTGGVSAVRALRATPPFTETLSQAARGWRFAPAEEEMEPGRPGDPKSRNAVDSTVLVAGLFRPPTLNTPTLGEPPTDLASASDETPFPLATVMPAYPPLARDSGIVLVEVHIDSRGDVADAVAIRSAPPFDEPAIDAARRWKFRPAHRHGSPVDTLAYIVFAFRQPVTVVPRRRSEALDPFAFFRPVIALSADDRRELDRGQPIARVVRGTDREVAVFAAVQVGVSGDRLVAWTRDIGELKKSPYVLAIGRFSDPPRLEDLEGLTLDDEDLSAIRRCRRGECDLKLAGTEMDRLRQTLAEAGDDWQPVLQDAFRQIVLRRVQAYLANGYAALHGYEDKDGPLPLGARFSTLLSHSSFLTGSLPQFTEYLDQFPHAPMSDVESFAYWSKERLDGKAIISATHVSILRSADRTLPDALVAGKGIFATHYVNASLGLTAIMRGSPGSPSYLAYVNRSEVDVVRGLFGGLVRVFMERRLKKEASTVLIGLRQRLESGDPYGIDQESTRR